MSIATTKMITQDINNYVNMGLSVILVKANKKSSGNWKDAQSNPFSVDYLMRKLTSSDDPLYPAIVTGHVSGNMEVIDIDVKNWEGIDALYFTEIKELYPILFARLRIHRTQSGGYHILYRCKEPIGEGNLKLATKADEKGAAIETRGEGGYFVAPHTPGYTVFQDVSIPTITIQERNSLITVAKAFNQKSKPIAPPKSKIFKPSIYTENPFDHFNSSQEARDILLKHGYELYQETKQYLHFTRPGKTKGISVSFIKEFNLYHFFTTSTEFEDKAYTPTAVYSILENRGNYKETYRDFVQKKYGKISQHIELQLVKRAVESGSGLPQNASLFANDQLSLEENLVKERYPYGLFWMEGESGKMEISESKLLDMIVEMGYREWLGGLVKVSGFRVDRIELNEFLDNIKGYVKEEGLRKLMILDAFEGFMSTKWKYITMRTRKLDGERILRSDRDKSYMCYRNCFLEVTKEGIVEIGYEVLEEGGTLVFSDKILDRDWVRDQNYEGSLYYQFMDNAVGVEKNERHSMKVIGWLLHDYKDSSLSYMVVLTEEVDDPMDGGGSGKNLFMDLLGHATTVNNVPGYGLKLDSNDRLLKTWNYQRLIVLSDVRKNFDYEALKNEVSNDGVMRKLYKDEVIIPVEEMPKIVILTNYSINVKDGGIKRRMINLEFTDFYTLSGGVKRHHGGKLFPTDWDEMGWRHFDNFIVDSIVEYLRSSKQLSMIKLSEGGWLKKFAATYNEEFIEFIEEHSDNWVARGKVSTKEIDDDYSTFSLRNRSGYQLKPRHRNRGLEEWFGNKGIPCKTNITIRIGDNVQKGILFGEENVGSKFVKLHYEEEDGTQSVLPWADMFSSERMSKSDYLEDKGGDIDLDAIECPF